MPQKNVKAPLNKKVLDALYERNLSFCEGLLDDTKKKILTVISDSLVKGDDIWSIVDKLKDIGFDKNRAEMIARTEVMYSLNQASIEAFAEDGIEYVEWLTAFDDRTCDETNGPEIELPDGSVVYGCEAMNGKIFKIDEVPAIPVHPACRCTISASRGPENY